MPLRTRKSATASADTASLNRIVSSSGSPTTATPACPSDHASSARSHAVHLVPGLRRKRRQPRRGSSCQTQRPAVRLQPVGRHRYTYLHPRRPGSTVYENVSVVLPEPPS